MAWSITWGPVSMPNTHNTEIGYVTRNLIPAAQLGTSGTAFRLTLAHRIADYKIDECYAGHQGTSGTAYDFDGTQVRVTFDSGSNGCLVASTADKVSDQIAYAFDHTKPFLISYYVNDASYDDFPYGVVTGITLFQEAGITEVASTHMTTASTTSNQAMVFSEIEVVVSDNQNLEINGVLPVFTINCNDGVNLGEVNGNVDFYPTLNAYGGGSQYGETNATLPAITLSSAYGGAILNDIIPLMVLSFTAHLSSIAEMILGFPQITINAIGHEESTAELNGTLPVISLLSSASEGPVASFNGVLPFIQLSSDAIQSMLAQVNGSLPAITIQASQYWMANAEVNAVLPSFILSSRILGEISIVVMNTKNLAVTHYNNYDFNSMAYLNGKLLGAKSDGIYKLAGNNDGNGIIPWKIRIEKFDLAIKDYKQSAMQHKMRYIWFTGETNGDLVLTLEDYVGNRWTYPTESVTSNAHELKIKVGKGIKTRYISIELEPDDMGANVVLDHLDLYGEKTDRPR